VELTGRGNCQAGQPLGQNRLPAAAARVPLATLRAAPRQLNGPPAVGADSFEGGQRSVLPDLWRGVPRAPAAAAQFAHARRPSGRHPPRLGRVRSSLRVAVGDRAPARRGGIAGESCVGGCTAPSDRALPQLDAQLPSRSPRARGCDLRAVLVQETRPASPWLAFPLGRSCNGFHHRIPAAAIPLDGTS
jgi:hypothetical protein